jgi:CubicO group peptidase (beta-lactamase class C family)
MLLTKVVEKASGLPFADFADRRLFRPLGMAHTQVNADFTAVVPQRALGYNPRTPAVVAQARKEGWYVREGTGRYAWVTNPRTSPHYGGSGVLTTLEDLARWDRNFYTQQFGGRRVLRPDAPARAVRAPQGQRRASASCSGATRG